MIIKHHFSKEYNLGILYNYPLLGEFVCFASCKYKYTGKRGGEGKPWNETIQCVRMVLFVWNWDSFFRLLKAWSFIFSVHQSGAQWRAYTHLGARIYLGMSLTWCFPKTLISDQEFYSASISIFIISNQYITNYTSNHWILLRTCSLRTVKIYNSPRSKYICVYVFEFFLIYLLWNYAMINSKIMCF